MIRLRTPLAERDIFDEVLSYESPSARIRRKSLDEPVEDFLSHCGKRIRAGLIENAYRLAGGESAVPGSVIEAVELLHAGSLIIDDIQDDSSHRRGQPALHRQIGVPLSINAGNWLYFRAFEALSCGDVPSRFRERVMRGTIRCVRRCHEGQAIDLAASIRTIDCGAVAETARAISESKTGALVGLSTWLGAVCAEADRVTCRALGRFGKQVGLCLQMHNDLKELRLLVSEGIRPDDLRNARVTWPWAWASRRLPHQEFEVLRSLLGQRAPKLRELQEIASILLAQTESYGVRVINRRLDAALTLIGEHVETTHELRDSLSALRTIQ